MRIINAFSLMIFLSLHVSADDTICPVVKDEPWDKMKESDFTMIKVQEKLRDLEAVFKEDIEVAEEFIWQANIVIEGGFLLQQFNRSKENSKSREVAKKAFCEFMSARAYLAH